MDRLRRCELAVAPRKQSGGFQCATFKRGAEPCAGAIEANPHCAQTRPLQAGSMGTEQERSMNLVVWLPAMFALGLVSLGVCYAFIFACEDI